MLTFMVSDVGDKGFDSMVLIDDIYVESCIFSCDGKECGDDGCGGVCGECGGLGACVAVVC